MLYPLFIGEGKALKVDLVLKDLKAYVNGAVVECCLAIAKDRIFKIGKEAQMPMADVKLSLRGLLALPGLIDVHVHLRDEGKAYKEDFYTGTAAAAAGGFTTVLDMPNNDPVTMSVEALRNRIAIAKRRILVNVGFYSEFPRNLGEIDELIADGAVAFKLFLNHQVGGLDVNDNNALTEAFRKAGSKVPVAVHAEDGDMLKSVEETLRHRGCSDLEAYLDVHSEKAEVKAVGRLIEVVRKTGACVHFCHISTKTGLETLVEAKKAELPVTCEVTPHHLFCSIDDLKRLGTFALTMPPVREKIHVDYLWNGVKNGFVDVLASDHAPHAVDEKKAYAIWDVEVGVPGLETTLPLLLTAVNAGRLGLDDVVRLMAENPAKIFRLKRRGILEEGFKADLVVVDLKRSHRVDAARFHSKAKYSPFDGKLVKGKPVKTFVNGQLVMDEGEIVAEAGCSEIVVREAWAV